MGPTPSLLTLGKVGASSFRECGIWPLVSADSQHFLGLKPGQVLCAVQQTLLLSSSQTPQVVRSARSASSVPGTKRAWLRPNQSPVAASPARANLLLGANTLGKEVNSPG